MKKSEINKRKKAGFRHVQLVQNHQILEEGRATVMLWGSLIKSRERKSPTREIDLVLACKR